MVYARPEGRNGEPLTFGVSGRLWRDTLVMYDEETRSLWSQLKGEGIWGAMKGAELEEVPAVRTTWGEWRRRHPETLALAKPRGVQGSAYQGYFDSEKKLGVTGRSLKDQRLPGKTLVYGLDGGDGMKERPVAVPLAGGERDVISLALGGDQVVVARNGEGATAWITRRRLRWNASGDALADEEGRLWNPETGEARSPGVEDLQPAGGFQTYWFTWAAFHPSARIVGDGRVDTRSVPDSESPQTRPSD